jgi:hypothetical protein
VDGAFDLALAKKRIYRASYVVGGDDANDS